MKAFIGAFLVILIVQVTSQQNRRSLMCFECVDCPEINQQTAFRRNCYGQVPTPTLQTNPTTISLTPPTTTVASASGQNTNIVTESSNSESFQNDRLVAGAELFKCFIIRNQIGDRSITSRGCALIHPTREETCRSENQGENPGRCDLCTEDVCNSQTVGGVAKLMTSITLLLATAVISLRLV